MLEGAEMAERVGMFRASPQGDPYRRLWVTGCLQELPALDGTSGMVSTRLS
jgi:hypothetical protein